jgi:hypothetical protein
MQQLTSEICGMGKGMKYITQLVVIPASLFLMYDRKTQLSNNDLLLDKPLKLVTSPLQPVFIPQCPQDEALQANIRTVLCLTSIPVQDNSVL